MFAMRFFLLWAGLTILSFVITFFLNIWGHEALRHDGYGVIFGLVFCTMAASPFAAIAAMLLSKGK